MVHTRRSFLRFLGGAAALGPLTAGLGDPARASTEASIPAAAVEKAADFASLVREAALSLSAPDNRTKAAVEGTLARLQGLAVDHTQGRFILANIAAAEVIAYQDGREILRSKAIVGAGRTRTPRLASIVPSVRLNPPTTPDRSYRYMVPSSAMRIGSSR